MNERWPFLDADDESRVLECLRSRRLWRGDGCFNNEFETHFRIWQSVKFALAVTNGTHAIEVSLRSLGIGFGDEVIVPSYTFMSSASAVVMVNAIPIPVDVTPDTLCLDTRKIESSITKKTRAIMPVHIGGNACDMDEVVAIAKKHNLYIIEDCAQSLGTSYKSKTDASIMRLGNIGDVGCFSFQSSKMIACGEGGMIVTSDERIRDKAERLCNYGWVPNGIPYGHIEIGSNYRMTELSAAIGISQISKVEYYRLIREKNMRITQEAVQAINGIRMQIDSDCTINHGRFCFVIVLDNACEKLRDLIVNQLVCAGIPARRLYPPFQSTKAFTSIPNNFPHLKRIYKKRDIISCHTPVAEQISKIGFWIAHWYFLNPLFDETTIVNILHKYY